MEGDHEKAAREAESQRASWILQHQQSLVAAGPQQPEGAPAKAWHKTAGSPQLWLLMEHQAIETTAEKWAKS